MANYVLPTTTRIGRINRVLGSSTFLQASPFSGSVQSQDWGGSWWEYEIDFDVTQDTEGKALSAFLTRLRGPANTFTFRDPSIKNKAQTGTIRVAGGLQTGDTLITDGWTGGDGVALEVGDFFSIGTGADARLYQTVTDTVVTSGVATLTFTPSLRSSPADNTVVEVVDPIVALRPLQAIPSIISTPVNYSFTLQARENI